MSEPTKTLEALILAGKILHDGNPVLAWALGNVVCHEDKNGNVKPNKGRDPKAKIDPCVALVIALSRALSTATEPSGGFFAPIFV